MNPEFTIVALAIERSKIPEIPVVINVLNMRGFELLLQAEVEEACATPLAASNPFGILTTSMDASTLLFFLDFPTLEPGVASRVLTPGQHLREKIEQDLVAAGIQGAAGLLKRLTGGIQREWRSSSLPLWMQEAVLNAAGDVITKVETSWPVVRTLGFGERAIVRVVDHPDHGVCVLKCFRDGAARVAAHEVAALQHLTGTGITPRLLQHGERWFVIEYVDDQQTHVKRSIPGTDSFQLTYDATLRALDILTALRGLNCFILDLGSHNLLSTAAGGLVVVDLEFFGVYEDSEMPPLAMDFTVVGNLPEGRSPSSIYFTTPRSHRWWHSFDDSIFRPSITGLTRRDIATGQISYRRRFAARQLLLWWLLLAVHVVRVAALGAHQIWASRVPRTSDPAHSCARTHPRTPREEDHGRRSS